MAEHVARCQCGRLEVRAKLDPEIVVLCNCKACQRRTGSPFGVGQYFAKDAIEVSGEVRSWKRTADSGKALENFFCPTCGTNVYWTLEMRPGHIGVAYGLFDGHPPEPTVAVWTEERHDWVHLPETWAQFARGRPVV